MLFLVFSFALIITIFNSSHRSNSNPSPYTFSNFSSNKTIASSCIGDPDELRALLALSSDGETLTIRICQPKQLQILRRQCCPGETLTICNGDYVGWKIEVDATGVRIEAETPGKATFHDHSWFDLRGNRNTLAGIVLHGGGSTTPVQAGKLNLQ